MNLTKEALRLFFVFVVFTVGLPVVAQMPVIFDLSDVVVGSKKIPTLYIHAAGKWSDAGDNIGPLSTEIQCYKSLGFCDVANANQVFGDATVDLDTYDILRWDSKEIIAVDSSPICIVNTLRVDLVSKRVTLSSSDKGVANDPFCKGSDKLATAVLWGRDDIVNDAINKAKSKKQEPAVTPK
jgi:hypothetical protein